MKAMIFAAGLGTRLKPYTLDRPKALVEVEGIPMLEWCIRRLLFFGFRDIVVNVHHHADQIRQFLQDKQYFNANIQISDESDVLLDTGGGLKRAVPLLGTEQPILLHNVDVFSNLNLAQLYHIHLQSGALATLATRHRKSSRNLLFDEQQQLCGWTNQKTGETKIVRAAIRTEALAFSGIQVVSPAIFDCFPDKQAFSIIDLYLEAAPDYPVKAYLHDDTSWLDAGKPDQLVTAAAMLSQIEFSTDPAI